MKKTTVKLYIAIFAAVVCLPWAAWFLLSGHLDTENHENRALAERPALTAENYGTFAADYEAYFNDRIPFRNQLIKFNSILDLFLFQKSSNDRVIVGKNGWLFYGDATDGDPIADYQGTNLFSEQQLQTIANNCIAMRDVLAENGSEFVLFIVPNKERVFPELMPARYGAPAETYQALQVVEYLRAYTDIRVVYPYEELLAAKEALPDCDIWCATDTHWNDLGAYIGSRALLQELGVELPDLSAVTIEETPVVPGDLAVMLNLGEVLLGAEKNYAIGGYDTHNVQSLAFDIPTVFQLQAENADGRKLYVVRDSFGERMAWYLGSQFNSCYMRHVNTYTGADMLAYQPDVFVYETVERYISRLLSFNVLQ